MSGFPSLVVRMARRAAVAAPVALLSIAMTLVACEDEPALDVFPVELVDPAPDELFATHPLLAPEPLDCEDCRERRVVLAGGDVVVVRAPASPALRLGADDVAFIELGEPVAGDELFAAGGPADEPSGASTRFAVYAVLTPAGREKWTAFAAAHANRPVLVELEGRPVDLFRPLGWSRGLRIGVFDDAGRRDRFVSALSFERRPRSGSTKPAARP